MRGDNKSSEARVTAKDFLEATDPQTPNAINGDNQRLADLHHHSRDVLLGILDDPRTGEEELLTLLSRKELPGVILEEVAKRRDWLKIYSVRKAMACHPHVPRLVGLRLLRELYLMDLVQIALTPTVSAELRRNSEDQLAARLPQLPLGQKITLARRGPARIAGLLLAEGHMQLVGVAMDNPRLTSAQILKTLSKDGLADIVVQAVARHPKWSADYNVRLALVRHPATTLSTVLSYLPHLAVSDLKELAAPGIVPERLRKYLEAEMRRRVHERPASLAGL